MKNYSFMKKMAILLCGLIATSLLSAQTVGDVFVVDKINYTVTSVDPNEAEVSGFADLDDVFTDLVISDTVVNDATDTDYRVVSVGVDAFSGTARDGKYTGDSRNAVIETVQLPESVKEIKNYAFNNSRKLLSINLNNVEVIGTSAFSTCDLMTTTGELTNLISLGSYTFFKCKNLTEFVTPSVVTIGDGNVYTMAALTSYNVPGSVTSIGSLFLGTADNGGSTVTSVQINWTDTLDVTINATNFYRKVDLTLGGVTLYVPAGTEAMYEAHSLWGQIPDENIVEGTLPDLSNSLIDSTFIVDNIEYVITAEEPNEVAVSGFADPAAATASVVIPATVTYTDNSEVYSVVSVGAEAFSTEVDTMNLLLTSVSLPSSLTTIDAKAFNRCRNLESINLSNVLSIGASAFSTCDKMTSIGGELTNLTTLGNYAFHKCNNITSLETPSLITIGNGNMYTMRRLTSYNVPALVTTIGSIFMGTSEDIPFNVEAVQVNWMDTLDVTINPANFFRNIDLASSNVTLYVPVGTSGMYMDHSLWGQIPTIVEGTLADHNFPVSGIALDINALSLDVDADTTLVATITPTGASDQSVTWTSSEDAIASVANGVVTANAAGTANIYATSTDGGYTDSCVVTVVDPAASLDQKALTLISVYPNPAQNGVITIGGDAAQMMNLEIYSLSGAKVFDSMVASQQAIYTGLGSGVYMLTIDQSKVVKLIIE